MKPLKFEEQNLVIAEDQPEYIPIPALAKKNPEAEVIFCWGLTFLERLVLLITGKLWVSVWRFRDDKGIPNPLQPLRPSVYKSEMIAVSGFKIGDLVASNGTYDALELAFAGRSFQVVDVTPGSKEAGGAYVYVILDGQKCGYYANGLKKVSR